MQLNLLASLVAMATLLSLGVQAQNSATWSQFSGSDCTGDVVATGTCSGDETCACEQIVGQSISTNTINECSGFLSFNGVCAVENGDDAIPGGCFSLFVEPGNSFQFFCGPAF
ncbi:hypothetical protein BDP27DRAFT_1340529 [Rhodocollybia butyracea]|uniref:Extracellular membrane protein CFEM domain-containing protein n=1 Tax=Rhodocollybia butyracea TaxID=206335 RepID=A0A9P5PAD5_9AGAR|nr:hypothetical protein BDP27DRAFT_1340529 [Rhodocollybia butyracea]